MWTEDNPTRKLVGLALFLFIYFQHIECKKHHKNHTTTTRPTTVPPPDPGHNLQCQDFIKEECKWTRKNSFSINSSQPCVFSCSYHTSKGNVAPVRLSVHEKSNPFDGKVFISATQNHGISSWTLPIFFPEHGDNQPFTSIEEIMCPPFNKGEKVDNLQFRIETNSNASITVNVSLTRTPYTIKLKEKMKITNTPVSPWYKLYQWEDGQQSVLVTADIGGKAGPDVCALLSLQNAQCPVGTSRESILSGGGRFQSFQEKAGMVAKREMFPDGIHIVILPLPDNYICTGNEADSQSIDSRTKTVLLQVLPHVTMQKVWYKYCIVFAVICVLVFGSSFAISSLSIRYLVSDKSNAVDEDEALLDSEEGDGNPTVVRRGQKGAIYLQGSTTPGQPQTDIAGETSGRDSPSAPTIENGSHIPRLPGIRERLLALTDGNPTSATDVIINNQDDAFAELPRRVLTNPDHITSTNHPKVLIWWKVWSEYEQTVPEAKVAEVGFQNNLLIMAIFMALPLSEILKSYMQIFKYEGSEDQCYYNSRCMTSFWVFSDFSRVFTNCAYLLCGFAYLLMLKKHQKTAYKVSGGGVLGVSRNYGLFRSLGILLIIQCFMSALYHVCPNSVTLRFDMMFMYVAAIILVVGVWGLRHGSVTHHVYPTVALVGVTLIAAEFREWVSRVLFWFVIGSMHGCLTIIITIMLSYFGYWSFSPLSIIEIYKEWKPIYKKFKEVMREENSKDVNAWTMVRAVIGVLANFIIIALGSAIDMEVYFYILLACIMNMLLYVGNYLLTKKLHRERGNPIGWICLFLSFIFWAVGLAMFGIHNTDAEGTAAASRSLNADCILFGLFDAHDVWHVLSAFALFYSFVGIVILDDDLAHRNPQKIPTF